MTVAKRGAHWALIVGAIAYLAVASVPTGALWYEPGTPIFEDAPQGEAPAFVFDRHIVRPVVIQYSTAAKRISEATLTTTACEGNNGIGFEYTPSIGVVTGKDLAWWAGGNPRCADLLPGTYIVETTWTIPNPARSLLPPVLRDTILAHALPKRTVSRTSPPFNITPANKAPGGKAAAR